MRAASLPASAAGTAGLMNSGNFGAVTTGTAIVARRAGGCGHEDEHERGNGQRAHQENLTA